jgi:glycosyltransferase involved in cell wall biosynthesis
MVVAHIIDSLDAGGAETVAVNMANALAKQKNIESLLFVGRGSGQLKTRIDPTVKVYYLHKKSRFDVWTLCKLCWALKRHKVQIVHAHSTSFFWPVLLKPFSKFKLVWHDHFGGEILPSGKRPWMYISFSGAFDNVCCVSKALEKNGKQWLKCPPDKIRWLPNFAVKKAALIEKTDTNQSGYILCLANFRPQKDHLNLLHALLLMRHNHCTPFVVMVGNVSDAHYFKTIHDFIDRHQLNNQVQVVTSCSHPDVYISSAKIGVLSSASEGMPLALLEYGLYGLAVVSTNVGETANILHDDNGWLVPANDAHQLAIALQQAFVDKDMANKKAANFQQFIKSTFSEEVIMAELIAIYESLLT